MRYKLTTSGSKKIVFSLFSYLVFVPYCPLLFRSLTSPFTIFVYFPSTSLSQNYRFSFLYPILPFFSCTQSCFSPPNCFRRCSMLSYVIKYACFVAVCCLCQYAGLLFLSCSFLGCDLVDSRVTAGLSLDFFNLTILLAPLL